MDHVIGFFKENSEYGRCRIALITEGEGAGERAFVREDGPDEAASSFFKENYKELAALEDGLHKVGERQVFIETAGRPAEMVICGGGHVSEAVTKIAVMAGFHVTVFEDRPLFADKARLAGAHEVRCDSFENNLKNVPDGDQVYYVVLTRGHRFDMTCLKVLLRKTYAYLGMISSRGRAATAKNVLREEGYTESQLETLHSPIGLKIGAETPAEIAVSIMAEIIEARSRQRAGSGFSREILKGLDTEGDKVLITIIWRHGSAPREAGTKMVVTNDGRTFGTVGGGCVEADLAGIARRMLADPGTKTRIEEVDMSLANAEDEGMVCGGRIRVLLEKIPGAEEDEKEPALS